VRDLFERLTAEHGLAVAEARPDANEATASFAAVIGREPEVIVAQQARLADLIVGHIRRVTRRSPPRVPCMQCCLIRRSRF
jgi:hypothetical protein